MSEEQNSVLADEICKGSDSVCIYKLRAEIVARNIHIKQLIYENDVLKKVSEFYGNEDKWSKPYIRQGVEGRQVKVELMRDGGDFARKTLKEIKSGILRQ